MLKTWCSIGSRDFFLAVKEPITFSINNTQHENTTIILSVTFYLMLCYIIVLNVAMLSVIMLSVVAPKKGLHRLVIFLIYDVDTSRVDNSAVHS